MNRDPLPLTRTSWVEGLRAGDDRAAWLEMDLVYRPVIGRYVYSRGVPTSETDDLVQQVVVEVFRDLKQYSAERGRFRAWLFSIVRHRVDDWFRKRREQTAGTREFERPDSRSELPDEAFDRAWHSEHLRFCLESIRREFNVTDFRSFEIGALEDQSAVKVAAELGITENMVYLAKSRIIKRLREVMTARFGDERACY